MFSRLRLTNFKNFADAELTLGPLTVLVGTNASGKSNLREAFRFLHGVSRGYELAEILGEKWIESGSLVWKGLRGGAREVVFQGGPRFGLEADFSDGTDEFGFYIEVEVDSTIPVPRLYSEFLNATERQSDGTSSLVLQYESHIDQERRGYMQTHGFQIAVPRRKTVLSELVNRQFEGLADSLFPVPSAFHALGSMRFLDLVPEALRLPSLPGQTILGDRGENLSSVLLAICEDASRKQALIEWVQELTPLDVTDFHFDSGPDGKVLVALVEAGGRRTSALSASDGTLRFLALAAALLGPSTARFYFIEEIDNGIHPTRLHLLTKLIEQQTRDGHTQVVATTHSPQLLNFLSPQAQEHASLVYRLPGQPGARIRRIMDLPDVARILKTQDLARLHAAGWMEDAVAFTEGGGDAP